MKTWPWALVAKWSAKSGQRMQIKECITRVAGWGFCTLNSNWKVHLMTICPVVCHQAVVYGNGRKRCKDVDCYLSRKSSSRLDWEDGVLACKVDSIELRTIKTRVVQERCFQGDGSYTLAPLASSWVT